MNNINPLHLIKENLATYLVVKSVKTGSKYLLSNRRKITGGIKKKYSDYKDKKSEEKEDDIDLKDFD